VATVDHTHYEFSVVGGFPPGAERVVTIGPFASDQRAVVVTARPFDATGQDRTLTVREIRFRTTGPANVFVIASVRNVGIDTIFIYYVEYVRIRP
jgi:hypothetical protein